MSTDKFWVYPSRDPSEQPDECTSASEAFNLVRTYQSRGLKDAFYVDESRISYPEIHPLD